MQMKLLQKWVTLGFVRDSCYILYDMMSCFLLNTVVSFGRTCHDSGNYFEVWGTKQCFNLLQNGNLKAVKSKITGKDTKSKSGRLIELNSPSQCQILRLPSHMKANKVGLYCVVAAKFFFSFFFPFDFLLAPSASRLWSPADVDTFSNILTMIIDCFLFLLWVSR